MFYKLCQKTFDYALSQNSGKVVISAFIKQEYLVQFAIFSLPDMLFPTFLLVFLIIEINIDVPLIAPQENISLYIINIFINSRGE